MRFFWLGAAAAALSAVSILGFSISSNAQTSSPQTSSLAGEWVSQADSNCKVRITKAQTSEQLPKAMVAYTVVADNGPSCTWAAAGAGDDRTFSAGLRLFGNGLEQTPTSGPLYSSFRLEGSVLVMTSKNLDGSSHSGGFFQFYRPV
jgi:hypothetical protein